MTDGASATEVLFYHLEQQPLDRVLPALVERSLERGWRVAIEAGSRERMEAIDLLLWTFRDDSFLPHGTMRDAHPERQPIYLTTGTENPNRADVRFLVDGADAETLTGYRRIVLLFDGSDEQALTRARTAWKRAKAAGASATYWQQGEDGRWERKA